MFKDVNGKTLALATIGGFNQPQFYNLDIDNDGMKDLFVFDRTGDKVLSLISDGTESYTYKPEYDQIYPIFNDWVIFKDYDGDGLEDIWFKNELVNASISLYKNVTKTGDPHAMFEVVDLDLRAYNYGDPPLDSSDLYCDRANIPAIEDVDGDGDIDFLTLQKFGSGITLFRNVTVENGLPIGTPVFHEVDVCWGDFQEGTQDNEILLARSQWCFRKLKKHAGGSSLLLIDGDADGDRDLIIGNAGFRNLVYLENGKTDLAMALDSMISFDPKFPSNTVQARINTFPAAFYQDVNNDSIKDLIVAVNYTDKTSGYFRETGNLMYYENTGKNNKPVFEFRDSIFLAKETVDHGGYAAPLFWDIDADGDKDLVIATNGDWGLTADNHDRLVLYENIGTASKAVFKFAINDFLGLEKDSIQYMAPCLGDLNRDGKPELLIGESTGNLRLYNIIGSGKTTSISLVSKKAFNIQPGSLSTPHISDIDGDGYNDLLVGCYEGNTFYYRNTSKTDIPNFVLEEDTFGGVMANKLVNQLRYDQVKDTFYDTLVYWSFGYSAPFIADLDGNGDPEFILGTSPGIVKIARDIRKNAGKPFETFESINYLESTKTCYNFDFGANSMCAIADLDNDGINDLVVGNLRGGIMYARGTEDCNSSTVGIKKLVKPVKLFPNPTNSSFNLIGLPKGICRLEMIGVQGGSVLQIEMDSEADVDISHLSDGVYLVRVVTDNQTYSARLIKLN